MLAEAADAARTRVRRGRLSTGLRSAALKRRSRAGCRGRTRTERIDVTLLDNLERMIRSASFTWTPLTASKLLYAAANGMLTELDPYTALLEESQLRDAGEIRRFEVPTLGLTLGSTRMRETVRPA
jgi:hypothetical protein